MVRVLSSSGKLIKTTSHRDARLFYCLTRHATESYGETMPISWRSNGALQIDEHEFKALVEKVADQPNEFFYSWFMEAAAIYQELDGACSEWYWPLLRTPTVPFLPKRDIDYDTIFSLGE